MTIIQVDWNIPSLGSPVLRLAPNLGIPSLGCPILRLGKIQVWAQQLHTTGFRVWLLHTLAHTLTRKNQAKTFVLMQCTYYLQNHIQHLQVNLNFHK